MTSKEYQVLAEQLQDCSNSFCCYAENVKEKIASISKGSIDKYMYIRNMGDLLEPVSVLLQQINGVFEPYKDSEMSNAVYVYDCILQAFCWIDIFSISRTLDYYIDKRLYEEAEDFIERLTTKIQCAASHCTFFPQYQDEAKIIFEQK